MALVNIQILKIVDAGQLWVKEVPGVDMSGEAEEFHNLSIEMQQLCNDDKEALTNPMRHQLCLGRRSSDRKWYRVRVQEVMTTSHGTKASCFLVDYADNQMIPLQWLREAPQSFLSVPPQAKECVLWDVRPLTMVSSPIDLCTSMQPCKEWDVSATDYVKKLINGSVNKQAELVKVGDEGHLYIRLYMKETLTGDTICVNDKLVEHSYATLIGETATASHDVKLVDSGIHLAEPIAPPEWVDNDTTEVVEVAKVTAPSSGVIARGVATKTVSRSDSHCGVTPMSHPSSTSPHSVSTPTTPPNSHTPLTSATSPELRTVSPAGRGTALLQSLVNAQAKVGSRSEISINSGPTSPLTQPVIHSDKRSDEVIQKTRVETTPERNSCTSDDSASGSERRATRKPHARLPTHFLAAQQRATSFSTSLAHAVTPSPAAKVRFSDSDDVQPRPVQSGQKLQSILKQSPRQLSSTSDTEDVVSKSPTRIPINYGQTSPAAVPKSPQQVIFDSKTDESTSTFRSTSCSPHLQQHPATQDSSTMSAEDHGVLVHGQSPRPIWSLDDAPFAEQVKRGLYTLEITRPRVLQSYAWPALMRGLSLVGVAPARKGGKTFAYLLPLITDLLQTDNYKDVPAGSGPLCVVICSSWKRAVGVFDVCNSFISGMKKCRTCVIYGGGSEDTLEVHLINGCELLVCTPNSLLRMLRKNITTLDRLCHLVLDDADILTDELRDPVRELMYIFTSVLKRRGAGTVLPHQLLVFSSRWTVGIERFVRTYMPGSLVIISSMAEAAVFGQVRQMAIMCKTDQRVSQLLSILDSTTPLRRTVIFTQRISEAKQIYEILQSRSMYSMLAHHEMALLDIDRVQRDWSVDHAANSLPVLVVTGDALMDMNLRNACCVIHFTLPSNQSAFGRRLWCMHTRFVQPFNVTNTDVTGLSYLLVTEECGPQAPFVIRVLERNHADVPEELRQMAAKRIESKSFRSMSPLCAHFKAIGHCRDNKRCGDRHVVFEGIDSPGKQTRRVSVPTTGRVKVLVTCVANASCYTGHLLEHTSRAGEVTSHAMTYHRLVFDMSLWFSDEKNKKPPAHLKEDFVYAAKDLQHAFHRVLVTRLSGVGRTGQPEFAQVEYVDNGGYETIKTELLYELPSKLADVPYQGVELFCCRIQPIDNDIDWTDKASMFVSELIEGKEIEGNIVLSLGSSLWLDPMARRSHLREINVTINEASVRTELLQAHLAADNPQHLHLLYSACRGRLPLPDNPADMSAKTACTAQGLFMEPKVASLPEDTEYISVYLSSLAHPDYIYIQRTADEDRLLDLTDAINAHVRLSSPAELKHIDCGLLTLAKFAADNEWYRAKVVAVRDDDKFDVFFVDTGEQEWLGRNDLLPLPMKFHSLPFQAIECNLYHLEPTGDEWTDAVGDYIWDITRRSNDVPNTLLAQVMQKTEARSGGQFRYTIKLFDTSKEYYVEIGQSLVVNGYARPSSTLVMELFPGMSTAEQLGFLKIPTLCAQILTSKDVDEILRLATDIQHLVAVNQRRKDAMREAGIALTLYHVLVYLSSPAAVSVIVASITFFALNNYRNREALEDVGVVNTICLLLDQMKPLNMQESLCRAIRCLANGHGSCRSKLLSRGALRILSEVIQSNCNVTDGDKLLDIACDAVCHLVTDLTNSDIAHVSSSGCIESLCSCLTDTTNSAALSKCMTAFEKLAAHVQLRDALRKFGGLKALCCHLVTSTSVSMLECIVRILTLMTNGNRFNKDVLIELKATDTLQRLSQDTRLSDSSRTQCSTLHCELSRISATEQVERLPHVTVPAVSQSNGTSDKRLASQPLPAKYCSSQVALHSAKPDVSWHQDRWNILLTVQVKDVTQTDNLCTFSQDTVTFRTVVDSTEYELKFHLYELIVPASCEVAVYHSDVKLGLRKVSAGCWPRLLKLKQTLPYLRTDFDKFIDNDSDSDTECVPPLTLARGSLLPTPVQFGASVRSERPPESIKCQLESWGSDESDSTDSLMAERDDMGYFQL